MKVPEQFDLLCGEPYVRRRDQSLNLLVRSHSNIYIMYKSASFWPNNKKRIVISLLMKIFTKLLENWKTPQRYSLIFFLFSPAINYNYANLYKSVYVLWSSEVYICHFLILIKYTLQNFCSNTKLLLIFSNFSVCAWLCFALYLSW